MAFRRKKPKETLKIMCHLANTVWPYYRWINWHYHGFVIVGIDNDRSHKLSSVQSMTYIVLLLENRANRQEEIKLPADVILSVGSR